MTSPHFTLSWDSYQNSICSDLSVFQQNGELVDMTLAADGHHVKVHQLIMSLVSPYIKDLISTANCPHPIIFLNQISYKTLCSILEYIYTGEAVVAKEDMQDVLTAANALHLRGFIKTGVISTMLASSSSSSHNLPHFVDLRDVQNGNTTTVSKNNTTTDQDSTNVEDMDMTDNTYENYKQFQEEECETTRTTQPSRIIPNKKLNSTSDKNLTPLQYTLSNQGSLQLIINRYIYYPRYTNRGKGHRRWQCVEYVTHRCPATVLTKDEVVVKRLGTHTHAFHDRRILNKVKAGLVFTSIENAEDKGKHIKTMRSTNANTSKASDDKCT